MGILSVTRKKKNTPSDSVREAVDIYFDYVRSRGDFRCSSSDECNVSDDGNLRRPTRQLLRAICDILNDACFTVEADNSLKEKVGYDEFLESGIQVFEALESGGARPLFLSQPKDDFPEINSLWSSGGAESGVVDLHGLTINQAKFAVIYALQEFAMMVNNEVESDGTEDAVYEAAFGDECLDLEGIARRILEVEQMGMAHMDLRIIVGKGINSERGAPTLLLGLLAWLMETEVLLEDGDGYWEGIYLDPDNSGRIVVENSVVRKFAHLSDDDDDIDEIR